MIDPDDPRAAPSHGIPFPGTYVVDESGVITEKFFNRHDASRTSSGTILDKALGRVLVRQLAEGEPTRGVRIGESIYPPTNPKRFEKLNVTWNVYEGAVDIAVSVTATAALDSVRERREVWRYDLVSGRPTMNESGVCSAERAA